MIAAALIATGVVLIVGAVAIDFVGVGGVSSSFGLFQVLVACGGLALITNGLAGRAAGGLVAWLRAPAPERARTAVRFLGIAVQLGLLALVIRQFEIENVAFHRTIVYLTFAGFALHFFMPAAYRLAFFLLLSLAGIYLTLGLPDGAWVVALGLGLVGLCHLPVPYAARVALLLGVGAVLALARVERVVAPWSRAVWPILGSLFMFRLIVYLHELRRGEERPTVTSTLSYFFLLPNVVFPLFPVVDYATFRRTYYDDERFIIYQRGVDWTFRGVVQLIAYRLIYQHFTLSPNDVASAGDLVQYVVANFGLYVRVSGQFHLVVGILHLFGMHLPETHRRYFLASSFSDFWRRINIYWKDFMTKVVFYPAYFGVRRFGETLALVCAVLAVFSVTWLLHSYQWFWLLGNFPIAATDLVFWGGLALLFVANALYDARRGRRPRTGGNGWTPGTVAPLALRTAGTFVVISLLWSVWTSPSLAAWLALVTVDRVGAPRLAGGALAVLVAGSVAALALSWAGRRAPGAGSIGAGPAPRPALWTGAAILVLYLAGHPWVTRRLGGPADELAGTVRVAELNRRDATLLQRGYYENLIGVTRFNSQLWEAYMKRPIDWELIHETPAGRKRDDFMGVELVPSTRIVFRGAILTINQWGMRDREYRREKTPGTFRIATVGASTTMGWGVADEETYENLVETRLNRDGIASMPVARFESLNFSVPGHIPPEQLGQLDTVFAFAPDAVFVTAQDNDIERTIPRLVHYVNQGIYLPFDTISALSHRVVGGARSEAEAEERLNAYAGEILRWFYTEIVARCRARGVLPIWVYIPQLERYATAEERRIMFDAAREAGFVILDLSDAFEDHPRADLVVTEWDRHPNVLGHRLLATALYRALQAHPEIFLGGGGAGR